MSSSVEIKDCPRFPYGRWNNTSTNFKLFPQAYCGLTPAVLETPTNTLTVEYLSQQGLYGWATNQNLPFGAFSPVTISGSVPFDAEGVFNSDSGQMHVLSNSLTALQNWFSSISFADGINPVRTYYTASAIFEGGASGVTPGFNGIWKWTEAESGFTTAQELAYWQAVTGKTINVYIDNPSPKVIVPALKQQCCINWPARHRPPAPRPGNKNIFTNTSYQMKKGELYKYLSTNRAYLRR